MPPALEMIKEFSLSKLLDEKPRYLAFATGTQEKLCPMMFSCSSPWQSLLAKSTRRCTESYSLACEACGCTLLHLLAMQKAKLRFDSVYKMFIFIVYELV